MPRRTARPRRAALVMAAAWWTTDSPLAVDPPAPDEEVSLPEPRDVADAGDAEHAPATADEPLPALEHDHDEGFNSQDLWAHLSDPANSDLFAELSQLGPEIVRADATGQGRHRWPHYWPTGGHQDGRAKPCCTDITIHAAGAYTHPTYPRAVQVTVIWTGVSVREDRIEQIAQLCLRPRNTVGSPNELPPGYRRQPCSRARP